MCTMSEVKCPPLDVSTGKLRASGIFRRHADNYFAHHVLTSEQAKVLRAVRDCRTMAMGGRVDTCDTCGHEVIVYNSCMNRHCPACQYAAQVEWVRERMNRVLEVFHFHVVFTLPSELRPLMLANAAVLYGVLMRCAAEVLMTMGRQRLKGQLGVTVILHTWTREMRYHPHVHCIVTGGALSTDGDRWVPTKQDYLFPVAVMRSFFSKLIRRQIRREARKGHLDLSCEEKGRRGLNQKLRRLRNRKWVVYCEKPFSGVASLVSYLGRYTHRVAISDNRLLAVSDEAVTFKTRGEKTATVTPDEFIRRFLLHVLPKNFRKIRHFGLYASAHVKTDLVRAGEAIVKAGIAKAPPTDPVVPIEEIVLPEPEEEESRRCPKCKVGRMLSQTFRRIRWRDSDPTPNAVDSS